MLGLLVFLALVVAVAMGFSPSPRFGPRNTVTRVFEDFNLDFKNPQIISSKEVFSEKQLREYTAQYSVDERTDVVAWFLGLFKKKDENEESSSAAGPAKTLTPTVSVAVLEEKTAAFVSGKSDAKTYYGILTAAFGDNLGSVLPQILANLPPKKAAELQKVTK